MMKNLRRRAVAPSQGAALAVLAWSAIFGLPGLARASILNFDIFDSTLYSSTEDVPEGQPFFGGSLSGYGDRINSPSGVHANGTTTFGYGVGPEGYTENVVAHYGPYSIFTGGPELWRYDYGDLTRVMYQGSHDTGIGYDYDILDVVLVADEGFEVQLYEFDLGGWFQTDYVINAVTVFNGVPFPFLTPTNQIFEAPDVLVAGAGGVTHTTIDFDALTGGPLQAQTIWIRIDASNLGPDSVNIGIDNIRFGQTDALLFPPAPPLDPDAIDDAFQSGEVPEAASLAIWLAGGGAALACAWTRRRKS